MSALTLAIIGFMVSMMFFHLVVFGNEPILDAIVNPDNKEEIFEMGCPELYIHSLSGSKNFEYSKTVYDLKCVTVVNGTSMHTFQEIFTDDESRITDRIVMET